RILQGGNLLDRRQTAYDDVDRPVTRTDNAGSATSLQYDLTGNVIATTDPDGYLVAAGYDPQGRLIEAADAEGLLTWRDYDVGGRLQSVTDALGVTVTHRYHGAAQGGRLARSEWPAIQGEAAGRALEQDFDAAGNVVRRRQVGSDGSVREHLAFYDEHDRVVREVSPAVDGVRRQICRVYSSLGDLTELWLGPTTDTASASCNFADASLKKQVSWRYDDFGRRLKETDGLNRSWTWTYDLHGKVLTQTDAKGQTTTWTWGAGGLPATRRDAASNLTTWSHDGLGQVTSLGDATVTYSYGYDTAHRLASVTDSRGNKTLAYSYSPGGLLNRMTDSEGHLTDYLYDPVGRLVGQWLPDDSFYAWGYDARGRPQWRWSDAGVTTEYGWNEDGSLASLTSRTDGGSEVSFHAYSYDAHGQRRLVHDRFDGIDRQWRHAYDALGRLADSWLTETAPTPVAERYVRGWRYDPFDNIERELHPDGSWDLHVLDAAQQLNRIDRYTAAGTLQGTQVLMSWDANGSLLSKTGGGTLTLMWDAQNRVKTAAAGLFSQSYDYDPLGRRIQAVRNGSTTRYVYDGDDLYAEYASVWTQPRALYAHGPGIDDPLARLPISGGDFDAPRHYHADGLGSVVLTTQWNAAGADAVEAGSRKLTDPWGAAGGAGGSSNIGPYGWQGRELDETGLLYFRARYYFPATVGLDAPTIGRFVSRDPLGYAGGLNPYAGFDNDPVNHADPYGTSAMAAALKNQLASANSYYGQVSRALGFDTLNSGRQSLATIHWKPSPLAQSTPVNVKTALDLASAIPVVGSVASLASAAIDADAGDYGAAAVSLAGAIPFVGSLKTVGRAADVLLDGARIEQAAARATPTIYENVLARGAGFDSSRQLRTAMAPGAGEQIHHIVEQRNVAAFGVRAIHNTANVVPLPREIHEQISGYYSSKRPFTSGKTVREWLSGQSFDEQYQFGMQKLRNFGALP
ncbi:MAG: RHS repeat-associated core domain-containing protein, partial [Pseudomonadota bacterium]